MEKSYKSSSLIGHAQGGYRKAVSIFPIDNNDLLAVILVELTTSTMVASKLRELRVSEISNLS